mgnify:CR=1 FL=1
MNILKPAITIEDGPDYEELLRKIERIGRTCYKSEDKIGIGSAEKFVGRLIASGHESIIEHGSITVRVICDRGVSHEIVRHRIASYSQESTRYCNYTADKFGNELSVIDIATGFKYDLSDRKDVKKYRIWTQAMLAAERYYMEMIQADAKPEEARSILPNSVKTEIVMTMNLREWRHFFRTRTSSRAHPQIVEVSKIILKAFAERYPAFFGDMVTVED